MSVELILKKQGYDIELLSLLQGQKEKKFKNLAVALQDPKCQGMTLPMVCVIASVGINEVQHLWLEYNKAKGLVSMASELPSIMKDVADDSKTIRYQCSECQGVGRRDVAPDYPICESCHGSGQRKVIGDKDSRRLVFDTMKLTSKDAQVQVNLNQNFSLESLVSDASEIMKTPIKVINMPEEQHAQSS